MLGRTGVSPDTRLSLPLSPSFVLSLNVSPDKESRERKKEVGRETGKRTVQLIYLIWLTLINILNRKNAVLKTKVQD